MTKEEAIEFIKNIIGEESGRCIGKEGFYAELIGYHIEALKMAIQTLSQEPCERFEWGIDGNVYKITKAKDGKEICQQVCKYAISRDDRLLDLANAIESDDSGYWTNKRISSALKNISSVTHKSGKWIPVSKRLPEDEQEVLITYKINVKHHVWSAIWDELHCRFYDKKYRSYMSVDSVIAWMPLPEPYEPQESEDKE